MKNILRAPLKTLSVAQYGAFGRQNPQNSSAIPAFFAAESQARSPHCTRSRVLRGTLLASGVAGALLLTTACSDRSDLPPDDQIMVGKVPASSLGEPRLLSYQTGLYRMQRGVYDHVTIKPHEVVLQRRNGSGNDSLPNRPSLWSANVRTEIRKAIQRSNASGFPGWITLDYANADVQADDERRNNIS